MKIYRVRLSAWSVAVGVVLIVLSAAVGSAVALRATPRYGAFSSIVLVSPAQDASGRTGNPFLQFSDSLDVTADLLSVATTSTSASDSIVAAGGTSKYTIARAVSQSEPIMEISATGSTAAQARLTVQLVETYFTNQLSQRQTDVSAPAGTRVTALALTDVSKPSRTWKYAIQIGLGIFAALLVISLLAVVLLERSITRRRARPAAPALAADEAAVDEDEDADEAQVDELEQLDDDFDDDVIDDDDAAGDDAVAAPEPATVDARGAELDELPGGQADADAPTSPSEDDGDDADAPVAAYAGRGPGDDGSPKVSWRRTPRNSDPHS